jgi:hypothetical protein
VTTVTTLVILTLGMGLLVALAVAGLLLVRENRSGGESAAP